MKRKYKVTGKFCLLNKTGEIIKKEIYINKITNAEGTRVAMDNALMDTKKVFTEKYEGEIELKQISNVLVKRIKKNVQS